MTVCTHISGCYRCGLLINLTPDSLTMLVNLYHYMLVKFIKKRTAKYKKSNIYFEICLLRVQKSSRQQNFYCSELLTSHNKSEGSHLGTSHILCHAGVISRIIHSSGGLYDESCLIHSYWPTIRNSVAMWVKPPDSYRGVTSYWYACQLKLCLLWNNAGPALWQRWLE